MCVCVFECVYVRVRMCLYMCVCDVVTIDIGRLCGTCSHNRGVTLDLQSCQEDCTPGIIFFVIICKLIIL